MRKKFTNKKAFSLIELSIVILIVGIVIAGVTQTSRMVNAMRLASARNQTQSSPVNSITDLVIWLDATSEKSFLNQSDSSNIDNGDTVKTWYDISPFVTDRKYLTQATTGYQPQYVTAGINNLPVVRYTVTNHNMRMAGSLPTGYRSSVTFFFVLKYVGTYNSNGNSSVFELYDNTTEVFSGIDGTGYSSGAYNGSLIDMHSSVALSSSRAVVWSKVYNPARNLSADYLNGTASTTSTASVTRNWDALTFYLGNHVSAPRTFGGDIGEVIIYDRALKTEERRAIEAYLGKKWGITVS